MMLFFPRRVVKVGMAFSVEQRSLTDYIIEELDA